MLPSNNGIQQGVRLIKGLGFHLVPSVIHDIISHTGVVSVSKNAFKYIVKRNQPKNDNDPRYYTDYSIDESEAPTNMEGYRKYASSYFLLNTGLLSGYLFSC